MHFIVQQSKNYFVDTICLVLSSTVVNSRVSKRKFLNLFPGGECFTFKNQKPINIIKKTLEDPPEEFGNKILFTLNRFLN